jgi:hypothetical protein
VFGLAGAAAVAGAQPVFTTTYGIEFSTIGDVGNPVVPESVGPGLYFGGQPIHSIGAVNYEYRLARTEVTVTQWHEFITAYRPFYTGGNPNFVEFTGFRITWSSSQQQYVYNPAVRDFATDPSWRVAAAFCNWLHNDKVNEAWAFASGAYDTSTFGQTATGEITDQREHSPGARFWIPTWSEWIKGMHWDPDRYGPGEGGYWAYPHSGDDPPIPGVPGVGQTSGGLETDPRFFPVGSYPHVQSPWGLLDGSGSEQEWTETWFLNGERLRKGSRPGYDPWFWDRIDTVSSLQPYSAGIGFRLAAAIPSPGTMSTVLVAALVPTRKRRHP